jgi:spore coat polysaccharide biosynthesis protein SpsF (cytidylyltransferase family)
MNIAAIIQARMGSSRFPGKTMHRVGKMPMLQYILERLDHSKIQNQIIIATSKNKLDRVIYEYCMRNNIICYRGDESNVASRFFEIINKYKLDAFVRINGDSPFLDQRLIDKGIDIFQSNEFDLVTNIYPRTYPKGQSVEIVNANIFRTAYQSMETPEELEHITRFFYNHSGKFKIYNFVSGEKYQDIQLAIDTQQDVNNFQMIVSKMNRPHWEYTFEEVIQFYRDITTEN